MTDTEVITGTLVDRAAPAEPGTGVATVEPAGATSAIEAAAEAALAMPGVPGRDEFLSLAMQARVLSLSGAAPAAVRNNPHVAFHVAMVGRDLGISPSAALQLIDVINAKGGYQLSLSPQLLNAQIRRLGLGAVRPVVQERDRCIAEAVAPDGTVLGQTEFTWEDARDAELVGPKCMPGSHVKEQTRSSNGRSWKVCGCNQGYITYPRRMMWWRASGFCANDWFPEAGLGLYSPEELGAVVDGDGRPIDPATVALPEGYTDPGEQQRAVEAAADQPADPDVLWELQTSIHALPEGLRDELKTQWMHEECRVRAFPPYALPERLVKTASAMVNAKWAAARRVGVAQADEMAALHERLARLATSIRWGVGLVDDRPPAPESPTDGPEPSPGPDLPGDPSEPTGDDAGPESEPVDWAPVAREVAEEVRAAAQGVPDEVAGRITRAVADLHHTKVNAAITEAELGDSFPPGAPIDLRRMVVASLWMVAFRETGAIPGDTTD